MQLYSVVHVCMYIVAQHSHLEDMPCKFKTNAMYITTLFPYSLMANVLLHNLYAFRVKFAEKYFQL